MLTLKQLRLLRGLGPESLLGYALLEPGLLDDLFEGESLLGVHRQQAHDNAHGVKSQERGDLIVAFEDFLVQKRCLLFFERQIATDHGIQGNAAGPDIHGEALVSQSLHHLRSCVAGTTACGIEKYFIPFCVLIDVREAKVYYFDCFAVFVEQQVLRFDVSMRNLVPVEEFYTLNKLIVEECSFSFRESPFAHYVVKQLTSLSILHDHVDRVLRLNYLVKLDNIPVLHLSQNPDFTLHAALVSQLSNLLPMNNLDRNFLFCAHVDAKLHFTEGALAKVTHHAILTDLLQVLIWTCRLFF